MIENILLIITAAGIGLYHNTNKPTQYELNMEDGSNTHVVLQKNSNYACPLYCEVDHIHQAIMCKDDKQINRYQSVYHISKEEKAEFAVYCSITKILSMNKITRTTPKEKLPDVVSASIEE